MRSSVIGTRALDENESTTLPREHQGRRVLILVNSDEGGGVEHLVDVLGADLVRMGAVVEAVALYPRGTQRTLSKVRGIAAAAWRVLRSRSDMVIAFQPTSAVIAGTMGWLGGTKARLIHQSNMPRDTHPLPRLLNKIAGSIGCYSCNIANSGATEAAFADYPASYRSRLRRIDHGVEFNEPRHGRAEVLASLGVPDDGPIVLCCARLVSQKRIDVVIGAMALIERGRLLIVGQGPEQGRLNEQARRLGVSERVHFVGHLARAEIDDVYSACDIFAFPSRWETFGLAGVEAGMHGLPMLVSDLPALREVLTCDANSVATFVTDWTSEAWAEAIEVVCADPSARRRAVAHAALLRTRYSQQRMLQQYRLLYRELLA